MCKQLRKINTYIKNFPDLEIWIISNKKEGARLFWNRINEYVQTDKKPYLLSDSTHIKDGLSPHNALILLCGRWYTNPFAKTAVFNMYLRDARGTIPIGETPCPKMLCEMKKEDIRKA